MLCCCVQLCNGGAYKIDYRVWEYTAHVYVYSIEVQWCQEKQKTHLMTSLCTAQNHTKVINKLIMILRSGFGSHIQTRLYALHRTSGHAPDKAWCRRRFCPRPASVRQSVVVLNGVKCCPTGAQIDIGQRNTWVPSMSASRNCPHALAKYCLAQRGTHGPLHQHHIWQSLWGLHPGSSQQGATGYDT